MSQHTHLPAMVGFVSKHVAQHLGANRPRLRPAVSAKLLDAAPITAKRFGEHFRAAGGALGQARAGLLRRAAGAVELWWNLQVRRGKPDPLGADIVQVGEDRRNAADVAGGLGSPGGRIKTFDKNLVHAIIGGKDLDCGSGELRVNEFRVNEFRVGELRVGELRVNLGWTLGHGSYSSTYHTSEPSANRKICGLLANNRDDSH